MHQMEEVKKLDPWQAENLYDMAIIELKKINPAVNGSEVDNYMVFRTDDTTLSVSKGDKELFKVKIDSTTKAEQLALEINKKIKKTESFQVTPQKKDFLEEILPKDPQGKVLVKIQDLVSKMGLDLTQHSLQLFTSLDDRGEVLHKITVVDTKRTWKFEYGISPATDLVELAHSIAKKAKNFDSQGKSDYIKHLK